MEDKKKVGRPATSNLKPITIKLDSELIDKLKATGNLNGTARQAIKQYFER